MGLKPAVEKAIKDLRKAFPEATVSLTEDGQGGAYVVIDPVSLDPQIFVQSETWVGFPLSFQLPYADIYPIHVRPDLARRDGRELSGEALHPNYDFQGQPSLMLSRRSKIRDPEHDKPHLDKPHLKVRKVLEWLRRWPH